MLIRAGSHRAGPGGRARQPRWNPAVHERRVVADTHRRSAGADRVQLGERVLRELQRGAGDGGGGGGPLQRVAEDDDLKPLNPGGTYLDPEAAAAGAAAVAAQGQK